MNKKILIGIGIVIAAFLLLSAFTSETPSEGESSQEQQDSSSQLTEEELADLTSDHLDDAFTDLDTLDTLS